MKRLACAVMLIAGCTSAATEIETTVLAETLPPASTTTLAVLEGVDAAPGLGDRMFPELGNAGYDVATYDIDLSLNAELTRVEGEVTIEAVAEQPLASFVVDFVGHRVTSVTVDGRDADHARVTRDMRITPTDVIASGERFVIAITYEGLLSSVTLTDFPFPTGWQTGNGGSVFLFSEPDGASGVFPSNDHPRDRADVALQVTVPAEHVVVSGGTARLVEVVGDHRVFRFEIPDVAPYLVPLAIGAFEAVETDDGITTWMGNGAPLPPGFERQAEILATLEADLGPYPFDQSGAVVVDSDFPAALETQTLSTYTTTSAAWGTAVIAHELAHQWFGNEISLGQWDDIWLNEGPATFMTWRWIEIDRGREAYEEEVRRAWEAMSIAQLPPPDHPPGQDLFNASVYQRGGLAFVALR
ncbi:MAG: M1 family aminopeptidase [Acidimicrobiia bacterium]